MPRRDGTRPRPRPRGLVIGFSLIAALVAPAGPARAKSDIEVAGFSGSLRATVPIEVPAFHGLEPQVALAYDSQLGTGVVGVGWTLAAGSMITRPGYEVADEFHLDGNKLVPNCTKFGGTHCTRVESYQRITRDQAANAWYVWRRDGTKATYTATFHDNARGTLRWALTALRDPRGNVVTYGWTCELDGASMVKDCYLATITYTGAKVTFWYEVRPDPVTRGVGGGAGPGIAVMTKRLRTIDVQAAVKTTYSRLRAYKLTYGASPGSGRSLLTAVQLYGTNATLDAAGAVTGGTALPAGTAEYHGDTPSLSGNGIVIGGSALKSSTCRPHFGDFNGDGRTDVLRSCDNPAFNALWYGAEAGFTYYGGILTGTELEHSDGYKRLFLGDFNGDGLTDLLKSDAGYTANNALWYGKSDGGFQMVGCVLTGDKLHAPNGYFWPYLGDFDGDGKTDILRVGYEGGTNRNWVWLGKAGGFASHGAAGLANVPIVSSSSPFTCRLHLGDFDGDGNTDFLRTCNAGGNTNFFMNWSNGAFVQGPTAPSAVLQDSTTPAGSQRFMLLLGDFNGDGKTDLFRVDFSGGQYNNLWISKGWGMRDEPGYDLENVLLQGTVVGQLGSFCTVHPGDFNGDGRTDLLRLCSKQDPVVVDNRLFLSATADPGTGAYHTFTEALVLSKTSDQPVGSVQWWLGDFNGDGRTDVLRTGTTYQGGQYVDNGLWYGGPTSGDLLATFGNGLGGTTTVAYKPSSAANNTLPAGANGIAVPSGVVFPTVASVSVSDGRGDLGTTTYLYEGARWDGEEREFLGFRRVATTLASTGAWTETYYWQRRGTIAKPEAIYRRRADGAILSYEVLAFSQSTSAPYTSLTTEAWSYECNGLGVFDQSGYVSGCRRVLVQYEWDVFGNLVREYQWGDFDQAGDERTVARGMAPNVTGYLVGFPAWEHVHAGIGTGGPLLSRAVSYYDGATSESTPPQKGLVTTVNHWDSRTGGYVAKQYGYDAYGNETSTTSATGAVTTRTFDANYHVRLATTTNALGHTATLTYDNLGRLTKQTDANGAATTAAFDVFGRETLLTGPDGSQRKTEYFNVGNPALQRTRTSRLMPGSTWLSSDTYYDGLARTYKTVDVATGNIAETIYGPNGRPWKQSRPYRSGDRPLYDVFTYDEVGRVLTQSLADGRVQQTSYGNGVVTATDATLPQPRTTTAYHDAYGRMTRLVESLVHDTRTTTFAYDLLGRRTLTVDPAGNQTALSCSSLGWLLQRSDPDTGLWTFAYDDAGRVTAETDPAGQVTEMLYDGLGRATERRYRDGQLYSYDTHVYDETGRGYSKGRLTTSTSLNGVVRRFFYDSLGRTTRSELTVDGTTHAVSRTFDLAGRLANLTYPDGEVVAHTYGTTGNGAGRLKTVGNKVTNITYSNAGAPATIVHGNGLTTSFTYDDYGQALTRIGVGSLASISYGYDALRRLTSMTSTGLPLTQWTYGYDTSSRLTSAVNAADGTKTQSFGYDTVGRMTSNSAVGSYGYGAPAHAHAVTAAGANTYAYDPAGRLTSGAGRTLTYYRTGTVASITSGRETTSFAYDGGGRRVKKTSVAGTTIYVDDIYEVRGAQITKYYFAGSHRVAKSVGTTVTYLHGDHLGSTRLITNSSGQVAKRYEYAPYGQVIAEAVNQTSDSHQFTGQEADGETGLLYYLSRYYDPALGRFIQPDSIVPNPNSPRDLDPYAYAYNCPVGYTDPDGHAPVLVIASALASAASIVSAGLTIGNVALLATLAVGTALTFSKDEQLQSLGMILTSLAGSFVGAPLLGLGRWASLAVSVTAAAATCPVSPLDPGVKKLIGFAMGYWQTITGLDQLGKWLEQRRQRLQSAAEPAQAQAADPPLSPDPRSSYVGIGQDGKGVVELNMFRGKDALERYAPVEYKAALTPEQLEYINENPKWTWVGRGKVPRDAYQTLGAYLGTKAAPGTKFTLNSFGPSGKELLAEGVVLSGCRVQFNTIQNGFNPGLGMELIRGSTNIYRPGVMDFAPYQWY
jgi:RHS repeat-associated protein